MSYTVFHAVGDLLQQMNSTGISLVSCDILNNAIDGMDEFQMTPGNLLYLKHQDLRMKNCVVYHSNMVVFISYNLSAIFHFPPKTRRAAAAAALENETGISMYQGGASMNSLIGFIKQVSSVADIPYDIECDVGIDDMDSTESQSSNSTDSSEMMINNSSKRSIDMKASTSSLNTGGNSDGHSEL